MTPNDIPTNTRPLDLLTSTEAHDLMYRVWYVLQRQGREQAQVQFPKEEKASERRHLDANLPDLQA